MPRSLWTLVVLVTTVLVPGAAAELDPVQYEKVIATIRCDCGCHPQSVKDCACGRAAQMRREIHGQMSGEAATGKPEMTADELIALYVENQGDQILIAPAAAGFNLVAWLGPLGGLLLACGGIALLIRRWHRRHPAAAMVSAAPAPGPDDPYLQRLNKELEELE